MLTYADSSYRNLLDGLDWDAPTQTQVPPESAGVALKFLRQREAAEAIEAERLRRIEEEQIRREQEAHEREERKAREAKEREERERRAHDDKTEWREIVVDKNGQARQAGATQAEGAFIAGFKEAAERDLYIFSKGVMGRRYLTQQLHLPLCRGLQQVPPYRKLRLFPRDHAKTSVVGHCLPVHMLIQDKDTNPYFPGLDGTECRIMLSGETERRAKGNLRVIATAFEANKILRALWPQRTWEKPKAQSRKWSDEAIILPRENEYPDPTVFAIGVGGAVTGARPNVQIKDDLVSLEAANSVVVMQNAIDWHRVSRALMDEYEKDTGLEGLEYIIGTRWAVYDLYSEICDNDPTVDVEVRSIIEDGLPIWPERFPLERVDQLRREFGAMFYLLYMNNVGDPELVDFDMELVRAFKWVADGQALEFKDSHDDARLLKKMTQTGTSVDSMPSLRGQRLNADTWGLVFGGQEMGRGEFMKYRESPLRVRAM